MPSKGIQNVFGKQVAQDRGGQIRTDDFLVPNQALYQTELHPGQTHPIETNRPVTGQPGSLGHLQRIEEFVGDLIGHVIGFTEHSQLYA